MKKTLFSTAIIVTALSVSGCMQAPDGSSSGNDSCGASQYQHLVGGPSSATNTLDIPGTSRHYGSRERVATNKKSRLNFVHSGTAFESLTNPNSKVTRVFCG